jgi:ribosomal protein S18 acetylase RimI-like enzyme
MSARAGSATTRSTNLRRTASVRHLRDARAVRPILEAAGPYAAYALAYLDPRVFRQAEFYEIAAGDRRALVMHARGGLGPSTLTLGDTALVGHLLELHPGPRQAFLTCETTQTETVLLTHNLWRPQTMMRMQLDPADFKLPDDMADVRRLTSADSKDLNRLYEDEGTRHIDRQIVEGIYFGAFHRSRLVSAAGTHIYSRSEGVGVVGNVYTHPDFRSHGLATAVTAAVTEYLLDACDLIVLNVDPANRTARHIYEQLGYKEAARLVEAMATRRSAHTPVPFFKRLLARHRSETANAEVVEL